MLKNRKIISWVLSGMFMIVFVLPVLVNSQDATVDNPGPDTTVNNPSSQTITIKNPFKADTIQGLLTTIINEILLPIGSVVAVLMVMYAGFLYVKAKGNPGDLTKAHDALRWTLIGAAILLGAWTISRAIQGTIDEIKI